jgi:hypothetical protein
MASYDAVELVQLPRLSAPGALALGERMLAAAKPHKKVLSKSLQKALGTLVDTHVTLSEALRDQVPAEVLPGNDTVVLDRNLDSCWSGLNDFLTSFTKLPGTPEADQAAQLKQVIFPDGLKFILLPYELEWSESETRLKRIAAHGLDSRIKALGGGVFLAALTKAHNAYGLALGMTAPQSTAPSPLGLRPALDRFSAALRTYVVKVTGTVEDDEPDTKELADKLLAPLAAWDVGPAGKGSAAEKPAADKPPTGSPPAAPATP